MMYNLKILVQICKAIVKYLMNNKMKGHNYKYNKCEARSPPLSSTSSMWTNSPQEANANLQSVIWLESSKMNVNPQGRHF